MDDPRPFDHLPSLVMGTLAGLVIAAGLAQGLDAWHAVLVILGTSLQVAAVAYATRSVWRPWMAQKRTALVRWINRRVLRRGSHYEDAGTATLQFETSLIARREKIDWPETGQAKQIAALHGQVDALRADVDSLRDHIARVESGVPTMVEASSGDVRERLERQFRLTNDEAFLAGLAVVAGALLLLAGDLLA
jgi:hypothetical protein